MREEAFSYDGNHGIDPRRDFSHLGRHGAGFGTPSENDGIDVGLFGIRKLIFDISIVTEIRGPFRLLSIGFLRCLDVRRRHHYSRFADGVQVVFFRCLLVTSVVTICTSSEAP